MTTRLHLHHTQLQRWPANMRTRYNLRDVRRMALSQAQRAADGADPCVHDLVVTLGPGKQYRPGPSHKSSSPSGRIGDPQPLYIVAGHLRHAGNAYLGPKAPLLNCIVRYYPDEAAMLADMRSENGVRADISPLGWANNFSSAIKSGKTPRALARESGKTLWFVNAHLALLGLTLKTRDLIDSGDLPVGAAEHLLKLPAPLEAKYAPRFAKTRATIGRIENIVKLLLKKQNRHPSSPPSALVGGLGRGATAKQPKARVERKPTPVTEIVEQTDITLSVIRQGAAQTCAACPVGARLNSSEPAWHLALNAAKLTCDSCNIRELKDACASCPLAEMMTRFVTSHPEPAPSGRKPIEGSKGKGAA